ncbi:hypothetical protein HK099_001400 [Clydaea vesicula]|uniref:Uncharacterized protein n=1 Tax=Clydaea vesicula TaxID=447962 RepID=A0AAD5XX84_9FUNG|nr:hypothetical protein HK099_001400 [Clydaea vesicula]
MKFLPSLVLLIQFQAFFSQNSQECITEFNKEKDYFPTKFTGQSSAISIEYKLSYKVVTNKISNQTIVLYQCGAEVPVVNGTKSFEIPLKNVGVEDTTVLSYFYSLGLLDKIKISTVEEYFVHPCLQSKNDDIINANSQNKTEKLKQYSEVGAVFSWDKKASDNAIAFPATKSETIEARVDWINFVAAFFNLEDKAIEVSAKIKNNIKCVSEVAAAASTKPVVAWTSYSPLSELANETWSISTATYKLDYVKAAGGTVFNITTGSFSTAADFKTAIKDVDIVIDESFIVLGKGAAQKTFSKFYSISEAEESNFKFIKNKQVYQENLLTSASDSSAWFESAVLLGNVVLSDLVSIVQPSVLTDYKRTYLRNVFDQEQVKVTSETCSKTEEATLTIPTVACPSSKTVTTTPTSSSLKYTASLWTIFCIFLYSVGI